MTSERRFGGWLFRQRSWLPVPLALAVVAGSPGLAWRPVVAAGAALLIVGQAIRFWSVRHIGVISRTRSIRIGPLVTTGPYRLMRHPIYLGNFCLWTGTVLCAQKPTLLPGIWLAFGVLYLPMTWWEEQMLVKTVAEYGSYATFVPGWLPRLSGGRVNSGEHTFTWGEVMFAERGTLLAIAAMLLALYARRFF